MDYESYLNNENLLLEAALQDSYISQFINEEQDVIVKEREDGGRLVQVRAFAPDALPKIAEKLYNDLSRRIQEAGVDLKKLICEEFNYCEKITKGPKAEILKKLEACLKNKLGAAGTALADLLLTGGFISVGVLSVLGAAEHFKKLCNCV